MLLGEADRIQEQAGHSPKVMVTFEWHMASLGGATGEPKGAQGNARARTQSLRHPKVEVSRAQQRAELELAQLQSPRVPTCARHLGTAVSCSGAPEPRAGLQAPAGCQARAGQLSCCWAVLQELCLYTLGNLAVESQAVRRQLLRQGIIPVLASCIQVSEAAQPCPSTGHLCLCPSGWLAAQLAPSAVAEGISWAPLLCRAECSEQCCCCCCCCVWAPGSLQLQPTGVTEPQKGLGCAGADLGDGIQASAQPHHGPVTSPGAMATHGLNTFQHSPGQPSRAGICSSWPT